MQATRSATARCWSRHRQPHDRSSEPASIAPDYAPARPTGSRTANASPRAIPEVCGMSDQVTSPGQRDSTSEIADVGSRCTPSPDPAFIRMRDFLRITALVLATPYRRISAGILPPPVHLGYRVTQNPDTQGRRGPGRPRKYPSFETAQSRAVRRRFSAAAAVAVCQDGLPTPASSPREV